MGRFLTLRRIIMPQAMRSILPAMGNDTISMLKLTSIASIVFVNELTFRAQQIVGQNFRFFIVFAAAGTIYLILTSLIAAAQSWAERRYDIERDRSKGDLRRLLWFTGSRDERSREVASAVPLIEAERKEGHGTSADDFIRSFVSGARDKDPSKQEFVISPECPEGLW